MLQGEEVMVTEHQGGDVELQLTDEAVAAQGGNQVVPGGAGDGRDEEGELLLSLLSLLVDFEPCDWSTQKNAGL